MYTHILFLIFDAQILIYLDESDFYNTNQKSTMTKFVCTFQNSIFMPTQIKDYSMRLSICWQPFLGNIYWVRPFSGQPVSPPTLLTNIKATPHWLDEFKLNHLWLRRSLLEVKLSGIVNNNVNNITRNWKNKNLQEPVLMFNEIQTI